MDPVASGDFARLMQYGAGGVVAAGLLTLVVALFKRFVDHAIESNKALIAQNHEMQGKHLEALHQLKTAILDEIKDLHHALAEVVNASERDRGERTEVTGRHRVPRKPST